MTRPSRKKWPLVLIVILLITNVATLAFFYSTRAKKNEKNPPQQNRGRMGQFMVDQMKFDKDQEAIYWKMRDTMLSQQRPIMDSIRLQKIKFFSLLNQSEVSDSSLRVQTQAIAELQKRLDLVTFRHFQQIRTNVCRPDQLQKYDTVVIEIVNRMSWGPRRPNDKKGDSTIKK